jgi:hypothetical protein
MLPTAGFLLSRVAYGAVWRAARRRVPIPAAASFSLTRPSVRKNLEMKSRKKHLALAAAIFCSSALLAVLTHPPAVHGEQSATSEISRRDAVPAEFRGCESARTCRFWIEASKPFTESLLVVRPNGVIAGDADATAARNRMNILMSNMIHQHKRIELQDLRKLDDGAYAASIEVNGMDLSEDPILVNLTKASKN